MVLLFLEFHYWTYWFQVKSPISCIITCWLLGSLKRWWGKGWNLICTRFLEQIKRIYHHRSITYVVMFDGALNIQLAGELLKMHYPKISVMHGVEHTVSLFSRMFPKSQLWLRWLYLIRRYDLVQPKTPPSLSFSGMQQNPFNIRSNRTNLR